MNKQLTVVTLGVRMVAVFSLVIVFGCGADSQLSTSPSTSPSADLTVSTELAAAPASTEIPAYFTAQLVGGEKFSSAELLKTQPLAFWFWAPG